ncbi:MAG TPA: peptidylprolyl isomerase [bacterium]|nr:peptidylprolyl isomerase [bacterium]
MTHGATWGEDRATMIASVWAAMLSIFALAGASAPPTPGDIPAVDVVVVVDKLGEFRIRIDRNSAPNHVAHFLSLVASGQYNQNSFHRVIPGFLVQSGKDSTSAPGYTRATRLPQESSTLPAVRGAVAVAWRDCTPGTGGSEWYVCLADLPRLGQCGTFIGNVVAGMDVVDRIAQQSTTPQWNPLRPIIIQEMKLISSAEPVPVTGAKAAAVEPSTDEDDPNSNDALVPRGK